MLDAHSQCSVGIEVAIDRLIGLAEQGSTGGYELEMEEGLYEVTGYLLDLFRLEDEHLNAVVRGENPRLLELRWQLSHDLNQVLETLVTTTAHDSAGNDLVSELKSITSQFQRYRATSIRVRTARTS